MAWGAGSAAALLAPVLLFFLDATPLERATILVGPVAGIGMGLEFSRTRRLSRAAGVVLRLDEAGLTFGERWFGWAEVESMEEIRAEWEVTGLRLRLRRPERRRTFGRWDHQLDFRHLSLPAVVLTERARLLFKRFGRGAE
jgi:hypothetical protein